LVRMCRVRPARTRDSTILGCLTNSRRCPSAAESDPVSSGLLLE
jgi:hypothetical protein